MITSHNDLVCSAFSLIVVICIVFSGNKIFEAQTNLSKTFKGLIQMYFVQKKISPGVPYHVN